MTERRGNSLSAPYAPSRSAAIEAADAARARKVDPAYRIDADLRRGRGSVANPTGRYEAAKREAFNDGWDLEEETAVFKTDVTVEKPKTIITRNNSPDIEFDRSINPYRGCEHGCTYCFARPTHSYQGLSSGLDFETKLFAKENAPELLEKELSARGYTPSPIALGINTDGYQPIERNLRITRSLLEILDRTNHPVTIVTKSALVVRDLDILSTMAERQLVHVSLSVTTLDPRVARLMEPRAATPPKRLDTIRKLSDAGIPVGILIAPVIPAITDHEIEAILKAGADAGAREADYVLLRLPHDLKDLMRDWLAEHYPDKLNRVFSILREARGGKDYDAEWGTRWSGKGPYAQLLERRFDLAVRRLGLNLRDPQLRTDLFQPPARQTAQLSLF